MQVLPEEAHAVEASLNTIPGVTSYGIHEEAYIVAVVESHTAALEDLIKKVEGMEGVLAAYLTSLTTEDEESETA